MSLTSHHSAHITLTGKQDAADLSLLNGMHYTAGAGYLSGKRQRCLKGTRKDVLLQIERWLMDEQDQRVFWLNGLAGTGKSTIAQTFAEISFADGKLGASFFCSRDFEDRSNLQAIFPTLAFQLAYRYPPFRDQLLPVLRANPEIGRESLCSQLEKAIVGPLKATDIQTLIIIDALDECKDEEPASAILSVLSRYVDEIPGVKFFITGRPEPRIRSGFRLESLRPITDVLRLHDVERSSVDGDIKLFLRTRLTDITKTRSGCDFTEDWPSSYDVDILCKKAAGLFIYASTVVKFVASQHHLPTERLTLIIPLPQSTAHEGKSGIDLLYTQVLEHAFHDADSDEQELYSRFKFVVGTVLLIFYPLSRKTLSDLLRNCETPSRISNTLRSLHSLLLVPDNDVDPVRVFHKSFPDFLTDPGRCKDARFFIDPSVRHVDILFSCLSLMEEKLKKNICDLDDYAILSEVKDLPARKEACIGGALEYACRFWTKHLAKIPGNGVNVERVHGAIDEFFATRLLFWIEVLSITGHLGLSVYAINEIRQWRISVSHTEGIHTRHIFTRSFQTGASTTKHADDSQRFILENFDVIHNSPSHIHHTALPFTPSSWIRECYKTELAREAKVVMGLPNEWDACSRTIFLQGQPSAIAYRGDIIAIGLASSDVVTLDAITGKSTSVLSGHTGAVSSLAFSIDGTLLVSGSGDMSVKLWDVPTGGAIKTFSGHPSEVSSVSISPDHATIASGSREGKIYLWDVRTGKRLHIAPRHNSVVTAISFRPVDPQRLISSSMDKTVRQWGVDGRRIGPLYREASEVAHVAYSLDGALFLSCGGSVATVRDSESGTEAAKLRVEKGVFQCGCFSPNGRFVACATDYVIYVWDIAGPEPLLVEKFVGHTKDIISIAFSTSLISGSRDRSVKFWQIGASSTLMDPTTTDVEPASLASAAITSFKVFAEDFIVVTGDHCGAVKTWDITTGRCESSFSTPAKGARDVSLVNGTLIVVWWQGYHEDPNLAWRHHIWDARKGRLLRTVCERSDKPNDLKISGDRSKMFVLTHHSIEVLSMQTGQAVGRVSGELDRRWMKGTGPLIVHGSKVWLARSKGMGWDFGGPGAPVPLSGESPDRPCLDFIDRSTRNDIRPGWVQDTVTGNLIFRLPESYTKPPTKALWDGWHLALVRASGEVVIMDFSRLYSQ